MKEAIILGIIQGIFEWFPVSSSGHLIIFQKFFNFKVDITFDVFLHLSSLVAIFIFFWKDIKEIGSKFFTFQKETYEFKIGIYIIISSIITGFIGFFLKGHITIFENFKLLSFAFLFTSILLLLTGIKKIGKNRKVDIKTSFITGIFQGVALLPGVSRSGATICSCLIAGVNREDTFRYSFLLGIPAILGAIIIEIPEIKKLYNPTFLLTGFTISLFISFVSLFLLRRVFLRGKFYLFGFYTLLISIVLLFIQ